MLKSVSDVKLFTNVKSQSMSSNVKFEYIPESENMFYDIDAICRNVTIFWTQVPFEVVNNVYNFDACAVPEYTWK